MADLTGTGLKAKLSALAKSVNKRRTGTPAEFDLLR